MRLTREEMLRNTTCGDCLHFLRAPSEWTSLDFGFCSEGYEWAEADETLWRSGCESFEPRPGFDPCENMNEDDFPKPWEYDDMED